LETRVKQSSKTGVKDKEATTEGPPLINYTISSPEERQASITKQTKIIPNNNEDKNETEKKMRAVNRKIEDLKTETLAQFDYSSGEFIKFKN
jgi:hypothetical protein